MQSVITLDMIRAFAVKHEISLEDGTQYPGVIGTLTDWENGKGEMESELPQDVFEPLVAAYNKANGFTADGRAAA